MEGLLAWLWLLLALIGVAVLLAVLALVTDGRYFGKGPVRWTYDRLGPAIFSARTEAAQWQALAQALDLRGGETILDVGTAVGDLPLTLAARPGFAGLALGVDWSPRMMATARREAGRRGLDTRVAFTVADVRAGLPFPAGSVDVLVCLGVLETLPRPEARLRELVRVLRPGGAIALSLYRGWSARTAALSRDWYEEALAAAGFGALRVVPCRRSQDMIVAHKSV